MKVLDRLELDDHGEELMGGRLFAINQSTLVDLEKRIILYNDRKMLLTTRDLSLLFVFLNNPKQILSFQEIIMLMDDLEIPTDEAKNKLRSMVHRLRNKLLSIPDPEISDKKERCPSAQGRTLHQCLEKILCRRYEYPVYPHKLPERCDRAGYLVSPLLTHS